MRGICRDDDATPWRTTVGAIEQYRAAYGIDGEHALGARPGYDDMTRANLCRNLEHRLHELAPTHALDRKIDLGIEL